MIKDRIRIILYLDLSPSSTPVRDKKVVFLPAEQTFPFFDSQSAETGRKNTFFLCFHLELFINLCFFLIPSGIANKFKYIYTF